MSTLRKQYCVECLQCATLLQNEMEQLVGFCPHCFEKDVLENKKWFLNNNTIWTIPHEQRIVGLLRFEAIRRADYKCQECGVSYLDRIICIDHIVPITGDGEYVLSNLQVLCSRCMRSHDDEIWRVEY